MVDVYFFVHVEDPSWARGNLEIEAYKNYEEAVERAKELAEEHGNQEVIFISKGEVVANVEIKAVVIHKNEAEVVPVKKRK